MDRYAIVVARCAVKDRMFYVDSESEQQALDTAIERAAAYDWSDEVEEDVYYEAVDGRKVFSDDDECE